MGDKLEQDDFSRAMGAEGYAPDEIPNPKVVGTSFSSSVVELKPMEFHEGPPTHADATAAADWADATKEPMTYEGQILQAARLQGKLHPELAAGAPLDERTPENPAEDPRGTMPVPPGQYRRELIALAHQELGRTMKMLGEAMKKTTRVAEVFNLTVESALRNLERLGEDTPEMQEAKDTLKRIRAISPFATQRDKQSTAFCRDQIRQFKEASKTLGRPL